MTKNNLYAIRRYNESTAHSLNDVYGKCSNAKRDAWNYCKGLMDKFNGKELKVLSFNTFCFTAGFRFIDEDGINCLMYITPTKDEIIKIGEF